MVIASVTSVFRMPQISYASLSPRLNDVSRYPFFFRTIPSDEENQRALAFLVGHFGWYRIAYFSSDDSYGQDGLVTLTDIAGNLGVQIVQTQSISSLGKFRAETKLPA